MGSISLTKQNSSSPFGDIHVGNPGYTKICPNDVVVCIAKLTTRPLAILAKLLIFVAPIFRLTDLTTKGTFSN